MGVMTWTAPTPARSEPPIVGPERQQLEAWLDYHRQTLLTKCAGLTGEQLERSWFRIRFAAEPVGDIYFIEGQPDADFENADAAAAEQDYATFIQEVELARAAVAHRDLDETYVNAYRKGDMDLRWIYLHMIEEYARHNGHADLLRERIDGATGD
jgi:hypothetical protein